MPKFLIADFITEITPKYDYLKNLLIPFKYNGEEPADFSISVSDDYLDSLSSRMPKGTSIENVEEFAYANAFNKAIIKRSAMLVHSSALIVNNGAYLFSAVSGIGKSTHTQLWKQAFGDRVKIINDDKPVVRIYDDKCIAFGTPFDGGSQIALNQSAPLQAIIFIERGEENKIRKATSSEIISNLYLSTVKFVNNETADAMLANFDKLIPMCGFYVLTCNMDISAAYTAYNELIED